MLSGEEHIVTSPRLSGRKVPTPRNYKELTASGYTRDTVSKEWATETKTIFYRGLSSLEEKGATWRSSQQCAVLLLSPTLSRRVVTPCWCKPISQQCGRWCWIPKIIRDKRNDVLKTELGLCDRLFFYYEKILLYKNLQDCTKEDNFFIFVKSIYGKKTKSFAKETLLGYCYCVLEKCIFLNSIFYSQAIGMQNVTWETIMSSWWKIGKECVDAVLWIGGVFVLWFFLVYGHVFTLMVEEVIWWPTVRDEENITVGVTERSRTTVMPWFSWWPDLALPKNSVAIVTDEMHAHSLQRYLEHRLSSYKTPFSLLPPGKYLRIHRLGVEAPVIDVNYASSEQMEHGAFGAELTAWVVKYPFTTEPGNTWNTLVFWHSSVDFRESKSNPYGFIFSHLHELEPWDTIELVWNGQQHLYSVKETVVKNPTEINGVLQTFDDDKFLTLMACYPRFSTAQRILVIAKAISSEEFAKQRLAAAQASAIN